MQEFLLFIKIDNEESNISILLKELNGLSLIRENFEISKLYFDEW